MIKQSLKTDKDQIDTTTLECQSKTGTRIVFNNVRKLKTNFCAKHRKNYFIDKHVKIFSDSQTRIMIRNKMRISKHFQSNSIAKDICSSNNTRLTAAHIPGVTNAIADHETRKIYKNGEWMLNSLIFKNVFKILKFMSDLDSFAARFTIQVPSYVCNKLDLFAYLIDAFLPYWGVHKCYSALHLVLLIAPKQSTCRSSRDNVSSTEVVNPIIAQRFPRNVM